MKIGKTDLAYEIIKKKILSCELKAFTDISEDILQEELKISRTPIREALQKLEKEKFVHIYPRKGTIVSGITPELIHHVFEVREAIEPMAARAVCDRIPQDWLLEMRGNFMEEPVLPSLEERKLYYTDLDGELHRKIISTHNNVFIQDIMENIFDHTHRIRMNTSTVNDKHNVSIAEHIVILDSFLERNERKVEEKIREHIINARKIAIQNLYQL